MARKIVAGHLLAAVSVASIFSALFALLLRPIYSAHFEEGSATDPGGWIMYFDLFIVRIDYRIMLGVFGVVFVLVPTLFGLSLSRRRPEAEFGRWYALALFTGLLCFGVFLNLLIGLSYAFADYGRSDPF